MATSLWLEFLHNKQEVLLVQHRLAYNSLLLPPSRNYSQRPSMICFIGRRTKSTALRHLLAIPHRSIVPDTHSQIHLFSDPVTRRSESPLLFMDCELHNAILQADTGLFQGPTIKRRLVCSDTEQDSPDLKASAIRLYASALAPFSGVTCLFGADLGGVRGVARLLARWITNSPAPDISQQILPRLLIILETSSECFDSSIAERKLLKSIKQEAAVFSGTTDPHANLDQHFNSMRIIGLMRSSSYTSNSTLLRNRIMSEINDAQSMRISYQSCFTFGHFQAFFDLICAHLSSTATVPFDFVAASRAYNPVSAELTEHLRELLQLMLSESSLHHVAAPLIASALLLDSHPPGMHYFTPSIVFARCYAGACQSALSEHTIHQALHAKVLRAIQEDFESSSKKLRVKSSKLTASKLHLERLKALSSDLLGLKSHKTCFCCLMRMPEKVLTCGHTFCDTCIKIFGSKTKDEPHTFSMNRCVLCGTPNRGSSFQYSPPTAGTRILSIDGGGIRGVIPLVFLKHIEIAMSDLERPLQDHFDFVVGTSSGGLSILAMFLMHWGAEECLQQFESLAGIAFHRRKFPHVPFPRIRELFFSYIADCRYDSAAIEEAFLTVFGAELKLFNPLSNDTKIAVTATTARETLPCIFTNYNGGTRLKEACEPLYSDAYSDGDVDHRVGYNLVRAQRPEHDVSVSEAARCASAAPLYFKLKTLRNLGTFQDGALRHNNPINLALWENRRLWPERGEPDFALSLGTGTEAAKPFTGGPHSPVRLGSFSRLYRSFMITLDGQKTWDELVNTLSTESRTRFHRLNIDFRGIEPSIDDVSAMEHLKQQAEQHITSETRLKGIKDSMIASMFYFELEDIPKYLDGQYQCIGYVSCRLNLPQSARRRLLQQLMNSSAKFLIDGRPVPCVEAIPSSNVPFKRRLHFTLPNLSDSVYISIRGITFRPRMISGLPKSLEHLIAAQNLDAPFGRADHVPREKPLPELPRKRKRDSVD